MTDEEVVELPFLLPREQFAELARVAGANGMTVARFLRLSVTDALRRASEEASTGSANEPRTEWGRPG
jgi:hypothetical protein